MAASSTIGVGRIDWDKMGEDIRIYYADAGEWIPEGEGKGEGKGKQGGKEEEEEEEEEEEKKGWRRWTQDEQDLFRKENKACRGVVEGLVEKYCRRPKAFLVCEVKKIEESLGRRPRMYASCRFVAIAQDSTLMLERSQPISQVLFETDHAIEITTWLRGNSDPLPASYLTHLEGVREQLRQGRGEPRWMGLQRSITTTVTDLVRGPQYKEERWRCRVCCYKKNEKRRKKKKGEEEAGLAGGEGPEILRHITMKKACCDVKVPRRGFRQAASASASSP
jgi:hypothetical protein